MKRLLLSTGDSTLSNLEINENAQLQNKQNQQKVELKVTTLGTDSQIDRYVNSEQQRRRQQILRLFDEESQKEDQSEQTLSLRAEQKEQVDKIGQQINVNSSRLLKQEERRKYRLQFFKKASNIEDKQSSNKRNSTFQDRRLHQIKFKPELFIIDKKLIEKQKELIIEGKKVYFPYEPYEVQILYMKKVMIALNDKSNALLQSPTGTGKTLCLLSSVLSWAQDFYLKTRIKVKIIYMSRTHSQLKQVNKQLEKTCYRPNMAIFASREQLCIKEQLSQLKGKEKIEACSRGVKLQRKLRKQGARQNVDPKILQAACQFSKQREEVLLVGRARLSNTLLDIPKMKSIGLQEEFCPYFYPHNVKGHSTLFLMPYNYLLDAYLLPSYGDIITDSIIIFDEAHNVAEAACEGRSLILETANLQGALVELNSLMGGYGSKSLLQIRKLYDKEINFIIRNLEDFKFNFINFGIENLPKRQDLNYRQSWQREDGEAKIFNKERTAEVIFEMFCGKKISDDKRSEFERKEDYYKYQLKNHLINPLEQIIEYGGIIIETLKQTADGFYGNFQKFIIFATKVHHLLSPMIFSKNQSWIETQINHYRLYASKNGSNPNSFTFGLKCLVPWLTFECIKKYKPRSIILTSGTLKPLEMWQKELQLKFGSNLVNGHVIKKEQISCKVICSGPSEVSFNFTFDNMSKNRDSIYRDLIQTVVQISSHIPNGVLLVFPSFRLQNQFRQQLNRSPKKYRLYEFKDIIFEEKNSETNMQEFKKKAYSKKGAILALICRGKLTEGIDFPDGMCRAVIVVGIPYPNIKDPFIVQKKNHLDTIVSRSFNKSQAIKGEEWYFMGTIRAINQSLGRVIRHALDYGMIFLIDKRYREPKFSKELPGWISESMEMIDVPNPSLYSDIHAFFQEMSSKYRHEDRQQKYIQLPKEKYGDKQENKNVFSRMMKNRHKFTHKRKRREYDYDFV